MAGRKILSTFCFKELFLYIFITNFYAVRPSSLDHLCSKRPQTESSFMYLRYFWFTTAFMETSLTSAKNCDKAGNVLINVTLRRVRETIVTLEKQ